MTSSLQERELIEQCKRGSRSAQYELYSRYSRAMFNICLRMLRDEMDAEDLLQNSFMDVFTKINSFRYESTIGAWIKRIVINNCINFLKKKRINFEYWDEQLKDPAESYEEHSYDDGDVKKVKSAIQKLPDGYRVVFSLYLLEGYDHKEIGEILQISEQTSKSQYSRAKQKIRQLVGIAGK